MLVYKSSTIGLVLSFCSFVVNGKLFNAWFDFGVEDGRGKWCKGIEPLQEVDFF
jgi:hypothetical protein